MSAQPLRTAANLPVWKGGHISPFAGEAARLAREAKRRVKAKRGAGGERITRPLTVEEAIALRHDQTKTASVRKQRVEITLPERLDDLPDSLTTRADGSLVIRSLDTRTRVFSSLYRSLLARYELVLLLEKDAYMDFKDFNDFRAAVKRLPVPVAGEADPAEVELLEAWYAQTPERRAAREALEAAQDRRKYLGYRSPQTSLQPEPFPPQSALHFKSGQPLAPVVHSAIRSKFLAVTRLPQFRHMAGLPYFAETHQHCKGNTVLVGIPQFRQDTIAAFSKALNLHAKRPPKEFKPLPEAARGEPPRVRPPAAPKRLKLVSGMLNGRLLRPETLDELAKLPTLETLQGQAVGQIAAAAGLNLVGALQQAASPGQHLVGLLTRAAGGDVLGKVEGYRRTLEQANESKQS